MEHPGHESVPRCDAEVVRVGLRAIPKYIMFDDCFYFNCCFVFRALLMVRNQ